MINGARLMAEIQNTGPAQNSDPDQGHEAAI